MKIKKITWQNRRDFEAIYECEYCGNEEKHGRKQKYSIQENL